jgi:hypothetical protein
MQPQHERSAAAAAEGCYFVLNAVQGHDVLGEGLVHP